jgi:hypothetical protein
MLSMNRSRRRLTRSASMSNSIRGSFFVGRWGSARTPRGISMESRWNYTGMVIERGWGWASRGDLRNGRRGSW